MPGLHRSVKIIGVIRFIGGFARFPLITLITLYFYYIFHLSYLEIGAVFTIQAALSIPANLFDGFFTDRLGRRVMMIFSASLILTSSSALFLLAYFSAPPIPFVIAYIALGAGSSLQRPVVSSAVTDLTPEDQRISAFSFNRIMSNAGIGVGLIVAGIAWDIDPVIFFLVNVAGAAVETALFVLCIPESYVRATGYEKPKSILFSRDKFLLLISIYLAGSILFSQQWLTSIFPLYITGHDGLQVLDATLLYSLNTAVIVVFQPSANRFIRSFGEIRAFALGTLLFAAGYIFFGVTSSLYYLIAVVIVISIGEDLVLMIPQLVVSRIAPSERRGEYFGTNSAINSLSFSISPLIGTSLLFIFASEQQFAWYTISAITFITLLGAPFIARRVEENAKSHEMESAAKET